MFSRSFRVLRGTKQNQLVGIHVRQSKKKSWQKTEEIGKTQNIFQCQCIQAKEEDIFQKFAKFFQKNGTSVKEKLSEAYSKI